jgi:hypothetical protein
MCDELRSQLVSSILFGSLSLISNDTLRYTLLVIACCMALLSITHLKRPSTQLRQLEALANKTEVLVQDAKLHCARDLLSLTQRRVRLLE